MSIKTCPKCGAMITPQLERCRQCGGFLHGTRLEGALLKWIPEPLRSSPGTGSLVFAIVFAYLAVVAISLPGSPLNFSSYSLRLLGGMQPAYVLTGEWWRVITSMFLHADVLHVGFNLYALILVGPLVERLFDRKKMLVMYLLAGAVSMTASFVVNGLLWASRFHVQSVGASGAISGLIGAAWVGSLRFAVPQPHIAQVMKRWTVSMAVFGFLVPGIDNVAHGAGFLAGAGLAFLIPTGLTQTVSRQRLLSVAVSLMSLVVLASAGLTLRAAHGYPGRLPHDAQPVSILTFELSAGAAWDDSDQVQLQHACRERFRSDATAEARIEACEYARMALPSYPPTTELLAYLYEQQGDVAKAERYRAVVRRISAAD